VWVPVSPLLVVPVASKNANIGEMPALRTALACTVRPPLVALHDGPPVTTGLTFTVTDWLALPPEPVQVSVYVVEVLSAPVLALPLFGSLPDHPPEAAQLLAFVEDQLSVDARPLLRLVGLAFRETVAAVADDNPCCWDVVPAPVWPPAVGLPPQSASAEMSAQHSPTRMMPCGQRVLLSAIRIDLRPALRSFPGTTKARTVDDGRGMMRFLPAPRYLGLSPRPDALRLRFAADLPTNEIRPEPPSTY
jgi:hypothetical protein